MGSPLTGNNLVSVFGHWQGRRPGSGEPFCWQQKPRLK
jgi:hypothetical protein